MVSGIYVVGKGLSVSGFNTYVQPALEERGVYVREKTEIPQGAGDTYGRSTAVLASLVGDEDKLRGPEELTALAEASMEQAAGDVCDHRRTLLDEKGPNEAYDQVTVEEHNLVEVDHTVGAHEREFGDARFTTLGEYEEDTQASELFSTYALNFLSADAVSELDDAVENVEQAVEALLDRRLSDF